MFLWIWTYLKAARRRNRKQQIFQTRHHHHRSEDDHHHRIHGQLLGNRSLHHDHQLRRLDSISQGLRLLHHIGHRYYLFERMHLLGKKLHQIYYRLRQAHLQHNHHRRSHLPLQHPQKSSPRLLRTGLWSTVTTKMESPEPYTRQ